MEQEGSPAEEAPARPVYRPYATYTIIALNVIVFLAMIISGVSIQSPTVEQLYRWGAETRQSVIAGDYWRLLSCTFVHIGLLHIAVNMYSLYNVGSFLEQMIGRWRYILFYLVAGVAGSATSVWWNDNHISAGASGAIFGVVGMLMAIFSSNLIQKQYRMQLLRPLLISAGLTLAVGLSSGIMNNAAHIGGLLSGLLSGGAIVYAARHRSSSALTLGLPVTASVITLIISVLLILHPRASYNPNIALNQKMKAFSRNEDIALTVLKPGNTLPQVEYIERKSLPAVDSMTRILRGIHDDEQLYGINAPLIDSLKVYTDYRRTQFTHLLQLYKGDSTVMPQLQQDNAQLMRILGHLNKDTAN